MRCQTNESHINYEYCDQIRAPYIDGLMQERRNTIALAMELRLSCTNPILCLHFISFQHTVMARKIEILTCGRGDIELSGEISDNTMTADDIMMQGTRGPSQ